MWGGHPRPPRIVERRASPPVVHMMCSVPSVTKFKSLNHGGHRVTQGRMGEFLIPSNQGATGLVVKNSSVFCNDASSSTFNDFFERSIWRISPHRTFPGPTSTNV